MLFAAAKFHYARAMETIRIGALRHSAFYSPLLAAIAGGYLAREGLEPIYEPGTPVDADLVAGRLHVAQSAVAAHFRVLEAGGETPLAHFAQINARDGFFLALRGTAAPFEWSQLAGKTVLVDHFFQPLAMFRYALHRQGIAPAAMHWVNAGEPAAMERAFRAGHGDVLHAQGPLPQQLEYEGVAHVAAPVGAAIGPIAFSSLCARREWLQTPMARAFMRGYAQARAFVAAAPPEQIAASIGDFLPGIESAVLVRTIAAYQALGCWEGGVEIPRANYDTLLDVFLFDGGITRRHDYAALIAPPPL